VQRPIEFGADMVLHSTTKYLNGHSDSVGGVVVAVADADLEWLKFYQNAAGAILSPFDSWLILRGTKTLAVRMTRHNENGLALATYLEAHPKVKHVFYPCLPAHHTRWRGVRCRRFRACCRSTWDRSRPRAGCSTASGCLRWPSLGGVESLIPHPATMTHAVPPERRAAVGSRWPRPHLGGHRDIETQEADLADAGKGLSLPVMATATPQASHRRSRDHETPGPHRD
jgi:cystathionine beta-lyase/cystathionine gamma-synthase